MKLDGRILKIEQVREHLASLQFDSSFRPKFIEIHNTSVPDIKLFETWMARGNPTPSQWLKNLAGYYAGLGWNSMPHAFVMPDGTIGLGAPFNIKGTHSPSWNGIAIGIETVGEFEREIFAGTPTEHALVALVGELHMRLNLQPDHYVKGVSGIHFHKEDLKSTHRTCPGRNLDKPTFVQSVVNYMATTDVSGGDPNSHADVPLSSQTASDSSLTNDEMTSAVWLQQRLNANGAHLVVDGDIGKSTKDAVMVFQKQRNLQVDGIAGPLTRLALKGT